MAKENVEMGNKTFYLYDYSNVLAKRPKKIYSPYNVKTLGRTPSEDYFNAPDSVEFKGGQYIVDITKLGKVRYEQQIEWLGFYNPVGGQLSKGSVVEHQGSKNGRWFKNDGIHKVSAEEINLTPKPKVEIKTEIVEMQQIPVIVANNMNVAQLKELANEWTIELPGNVDSGDADKIKKTIINLMVESGHIKK